MHEEDESRRVCLCFVMRRRAATVFTLMLIVLSLLVKEASNVTLPISLPALLLSPSVGIGPAATKVPGIGSAYYCLGKVSMMCVTHRVGPRLVLIVSSILNCIGMVLCAAGSYSLLVWGWSFQQFAAAHGWGVCIAVLSTWVERALVGRVIGIGMAIGSDGGGALASFIFSVLLDSDDSEAWRLPFYATAVALAALSLLLSIGLHDSPGQAGFGPMASASEPSSMKTHAEDHPLQTATFRRAIADFIPRGRVWLSILACTMYGCENTGVQSFGATYAAARLGASDSEAALVVMYVLFGQLIGGFIAGFVRDTSSGRWLIAFSAAFKLFGVGCMAAWLVMDTALASCLQSGDSQRPHLQLDRIPTLPGQSVPAGARSIDSCTGIGEWLVLLEPRVRVHIVCFLVFVLQATISYSWNVMLTAYCLRAGGANHAATLSGILDLFAFAARIPNNFYIGGLVAQGEFSLMLLLVGLYSALGHTAMLAFMMIDESMIHETTSLQPEKPLML
mmetsp:Transcript_15558/g.40211  ORF Transcript_15558/g.40211 Transcript_15558/m.40211 type:complete len:505 (-) Transcript_15558:162-1676(-)